MGRGSFRHGGKDDLTAKAIRARLLAAGAAILRVKRGEWGDARTKLRRTGAADDLVLWRGAVVFLEYKTPGARTDEAREEAQSDFRAWAILHGIRCELVRSPEEALAALEGAEELTEWRNLSRLCSCGHSYGAHDALGGACGVGGHSASRQDTVSGARVIVWKGCKCSAFREPAPRAQREAPTKRARKPSASYTPPEHVKPLCSCGRAHVVETRCIHCLQDEALGTPEDFIPPHA